MKKAFIAYNLNSPGGIVILQSLLSSAESKNDVFFLSSNQAKQLELPHKNYVIVNSSFIGRIFFDLKFRSWSCQYSKAIYLGNFPPIIPNKIMTYVFLHNRFLIDQLQSDKSGISRAVSLYLKRCIFGLSHRKTYNYIVQTESMKIEFSRKYPNTIPTVFTFFIPFLDKKKTTIPHDKFDFIYVANLENHKNHLRLLEAFSFLAEEGIRPSLVLVIGNKTINSPIEDKIRFLNMKLNTHIKVVDFLTREELSELYQNCRCLIYPSILESLGLPLLEAKHLGLDVLASELDYVRDVLDPNESFDPSSSISIKRAISRYLGKSHEQRNIKTSVDFINLINE